MLSVTPVKSRVRHAAVAGLFYPDEPQRLRDVLQSLLATVPAPAAGTARRPKALIVPHAGYVYSGAVAASGYRRIADWAREIRKVVVIGPCHRVPIRGLALPSADAFETPLGTVPIDDAGRQRLRELGLAGVADQPHALEHSIEVQLPFLQVSLEEFALLPLAVGLAPPSQVSAALEAVWGGSETLIVVSSDLSHYHGMHEAKAIDAATNEAILGRRGELRDEAACGARGINGLLELAKKRALQVELIDLRNSGETAGDRALVVGYGSYALYES